MRMISKVNNAIDMLNRCKKMNKKDVLVIIKCKHYVEENYSVDHYSIIKWSIHRYLAEPNSVGYSVKHDLG